MYLINFQTSMNMMLNCGEKLATKVKDFMFSMPNRLMQKINDFVKEHSLESKTNLLNHEENGIEWEIEYDKDDGLTIRKFLNNGTTQSLFLAESSAIKKDYMLMNETYTDVYVGQYTEENTKSQSFYDVDIHYNETGNHDLLETYNIMKNDGLEYIQKGKHFSLSHNQLSDAPIYLN